MADIYDYGGKRKLERVVAVLPNVQAELDKRRFQIAVRAEELLLQARAESAYAEGHSSIDVADGDVDKYVILDDDRGDKAALSIEFGRAEQFITRKRKDGQTYLDIIPAADGLFILTRAANLTKRRRGKVHLD
ncbi:hypothetical protein [Streptomyces sp. C]|uniref:DUF5403 family protein n=1 Tax=Streptomyces sp. C TaxID=253839 RepID=UPI0001B53C51|nr:hypothetical protein [Streptomyces sp. C]